MQLLQSKMPCRFRGQLLPVIVLAATMMFGGAASAADEPKSASPEKQNEAQPIFITADQLISDNEEKFAEFIGNVKATQADFVMTSEKLRIYYEGELLDTDKKDESNNEDMLRKIIATGNVKIKSSQYTAESDVVEYDTAAMTITMTGEDSKVISGKNSITGSKIILYRKDGRVKVLGGKKKRVEATIYSGGKASDAFRIEKPKK